METVEASRNGQKVMKVLYSRWKCAEAKSKLWSYEVSVKTSTATFLALPRTLPLVSFIENSVEVEASVEAVKASFKVQEASTACMESSTTSMEAPTTSS